MNFCYVEMAEVKLSNGKGTILLDDEILVSLNKLGLKLTKDKNGYAELRGKLHHFVAGKPEKGLHVDHINRNKLDARKSNLRVCTPFQNSANVSPRKGSYRGVRKIKLKNKYSYYGRITISDKAFHLGIFSSPEDAAYAYDLAAKIVHKEFAYINFPGGYSSDFSLPKELVKELEKALTEYTGMKTVAPGIFLRRNGSFLATKKKNARKITKNFDLLQSAIEWRNGLGSK
ncbi:MAG: HNH endonuclease [Spirochaetes bacterium]|nr:MAG: HNH endonuclease [Spirochaetota bacterium]